MIAQGVPAIEAVADLERFNRCLVQPPLGQVRAGFRTGFCVEEGVVEEGRRRLVRREQALAAFVLFRVALVVQSDAGAIR